MSDQKEALPKYGQLDQIVFFWSHNLTTPRAQYAGVVIEGRSVHLCVEKHSWRDDSPSYVEWWEWAVLEDTGDGEEDVASGVVYEFAGTPGASEQEAKRRAEMIARAIVGVPMLEIGAVDAVIAKAHDEIQVPCDARWDAPAVRGVLMRTARALRKAARAAAGLDGNSCGPQR